MSNLNVRTHFRSLPEEACAIRGFADPLLEFAVGKSTRLTPPFAAVKKLGAEEYSVAVSNPASGTATREMMRDVFDRLTLTAAAIAITAVGLAAPVHADPPCPASGCPHGPANNAPGPANTPPPPTANVNSPSYKDGYKSEHEYFSTPQNRAYLASEMKNGYTAATACQVEIRGGSPPANENDWLGGCVDALHDLGFKP